MLHISSYSMKITIQLRIKNPWQLFPRIWIHGLTARPYGLPARLEGSLTIILAHAQKPLQGQCFGPITLNPKTLKPWKLWIRKQKTLRIRSILFNFSSHDRESSMLQSGQSGSVRSQVWPIPPSNVSQDWIHSAPGREQIVQRALFSQFLLSADQFKMPQVQTWKFWISIIV